MTIHLEGPLVDPKSSSIIEQILRALPSWFGIEEAVIHYRDVAAEFPTIIAWDGETAAGFLTVQQHNPYAAEIIVMGVLPDYHRRGIGRRLVQRMETFLMGQGVEYLQVKTLASTVSDEGYARTRAFYQAVGFRPLEVLPQIWNEDNPCLLMVKKL